MTFQGGPLGFRMAGPGQIEITTFFRAEIFLRRQFSKRNCQKKKRKKGYFCKQVPCFQEDRRGDSFQIPENKAVICRF